ncbi:PREDICTED: MATH domain and coiled-coil domain-containing protein At3g58200-like, partial [Camelina sativa]
MGEQVDKKFTWVIKNVYSLQSENIYSDIFVIGGCRWRLVAAYSKGIIFNDALSLYLTVADVESLPSGWSRHAEFSFTVVNQSSEEHSQLQDVFRDFTETEGWFDDKTPVCGFASSFPLGKLDAKYGGFILNYQVKVVAE